MMGKRQRCGWKKIGFQWFLIIFTFNFTLWSTVFAHPGQQAFLDYGDALAKCLVYFESQRSGRLPYNQRVTWRDHSGLTDGLEQGVDLVGGYYDAGDNVKFGLPMAFTVTMLSWSVIEYRQEMKAADEYNINHALEAIKWGTDYFIKAHTEPNVLWAQVGDGETDHYCWQRPEDMKTSRQAYKINPENPGSDLAGETAAAMAAASMVFKESNPHYSHLLLHHAQELFEFADKYRGKYDNSISVAKGYYPSVSGYKDELLWAALWLYHATNKDDYLNYAVSNGHSFGGTEWAIAEFSWDVKYAGVQILATKVLLLEEKHKAAEYSTVLEEYLSKAEYYLCSCLHKNNASNNINFTPGGLLYIRQWNNMQYVSNAAFLLIVYSDYLKKSMSGYKAGLNCEGEEGGRLVVDPEEMLCFAKYQADYMLGLNPMGMSYLVGFGSNFPLHVHHRGASIVSHKENQAFIGCTQGFDYWYKRREPNPNVLVGALVGGPDSHDNFRDDRENYMQTEACTYNTAPMVGVFAKLYDLNK